MIKTFTSKKAKKYLSKATSPSVSSESDSNKSPSKEPKKAEKNTTNKLEELKLKLAKAKREYAEEAKLHKRATPQEKKSPGPKKKRTKTEGDAALRDPMARAEYDEEREKYEKQGKWLVYTDGSGKGSSGYGVFFGHDHKLNASEPLPSTCEKHTANAAELHALLHVFQVVPETQPIVIRPDSIYAFHTVTEWMRGWKAADWQKPDGEVPANLDIVKQLDELWTDTREENTTFIWVESHAGNFGNASADIRAKQGAIKAPKVWSKEKKKTTKE